MISVTLRFLKVLAVAAGAIAICGAVRQAGELISEAILDAAACHCEDCTADLDEEQLHEGFGELDEETAEAFAEITEELSDVDEAGDSLAAEFEDAADEADDTEFDDDEFEEIEGDEQ